ncbi:MAG: TIGR01459 family HAD-type hydrolase [Pseudomonadota bacterium]
MTRLLASVVDVVDGFDVAVLDQFGVLLSGAGAYPGAAAAIAALADRGKAIVVLSNSGKRAAANRERLAGFGLPTEQIGHVVTSGEALWEDLASGRLSLSDTGVARLHPICASPDDATAWAAGNPRVEIVFGEPTDADAVLAMGVPDDIAIDAFDSTLRTALAADLTLICSNPDRRAPRGDRMVLSPGALAERYQEMDGRVVWYGKPHAPSFAAVRRLHPEVPAKRFLMIGDSLEHDIAGGAAAGFSTLLVRGGVHEAAFGSADDAATIGAAIDALAHGAGGDAVPTYSLAVFA